MNTDELWNKWKLPEGWSKPEEFLESTTIGNATIHLAGLISKKGESTITGSAACATSLPVERAWAELVERASILEFMGNPDSEGVFPMNPQPEKWRYALSNGVAANTSREGACRKARLELIERDRLLRSWDGEIYPIPLPADPIAGLDDLFQFKAFRFSTDSWEVCGYFGFPRSPEAPLSFGFGSGLSLEEALGRAKAECLQRLGFLWGEELPEALPLPSPTPDFHQEYFLTREGHQALEAWLTGARFKGTGEPPNQGENTKFTVLNQANGTDALHVVKADCPGMRPLIFGIPEERSAGDVHPIA